MDMDMSKILDNSTPIILNPPPDNVCVHCATPFSSTNTPVGEIHIYSSSNKFESSMSLLDILAQIFDSSSPKVKTALLASFSLLMCTKCAETVSYLYKYFTRFLDYSDPGSYLPHLFTRIDRVHNLGYETSTPIYIEDLTGDTAVLMSTGGGDEGTHKIIKEKEAKAAEEIELIASQTQSQEDVSNLTQEEYLISANDDMEFGDDNDDDQPSPLQHNYGESDDDEDGVVQKKSKIKRNEEKKKEEDSKSNALRLFTCHLNPCIFRCEYNYQMHEHLLQVHERVKKTPCSSCGFLFYPQVIKAATHVCALGEGQKGRENETDIECSYCHAFFSNDKMYRIHVEQTHVRENILYTCQYKQCGKIKINRRGLISHLDFHSDEFKHKCDDCGKLFKLRSSLTRHKKTHSSATNDEKFRLNKLTIDKTKGPLGTYLCKICNKTFNRTKYLAYHMRFKHCTEWKYQCNYCQMPLSTRERLIEHVATHEAELKIGTKNDQSEEAKRPFSCHICKMRFTAKFSVKMHILRVHERTDRTIVRVNRRKFKCIVTNCIAPSFERKSDYFVHIKSHLEDKGISEEDREKVNGELTRTYECEICKKRLSCPEYLKRHMLAHNGENLHYNCELCEYKTSTAFLLFGHIFSHHYESLTPEEQVKFECDVCKRCFPYRRSLITHKLIHSGEIFRFPCPHCNEYLRGKDSLESHIKFVHAETLDEAELNRWKCDECGKLFGCRKNLREHKRRRNPTTCFDNAAKGLFACDLCNSSFVSRVGLKNHRVRHSQVMSNYDCPYCKEKFRYPSGFLSHYKAMHPNEKIPALFENYVCDVCEEIFKNEREFRSHNFKDSCSPKKGSLKRPRPRPQPPKAPPKKTSPNMSKIKISPYVAKTTAADNRAKFPNARRSDRKRVELSIFEMEELTCASCGEEFNARNLLIEHKRKKHMVDEDEEEEAQEDTSLEFETESFVFETNKKFKKNNEKSEVKSGEGEDEAAGNLDLEANRRLMVKIEPLDMDTYTN